ncbi:hypothetical protein BO78DRAFT_440283 [Aspergillus sclerotiicarbonarius CBS 121057]|uniref:Uncharacterized protein n=1 Tax=Aspergillus sclerotiicarbonarius (strain CBS 121057 / IBT 28362) TaxID=1448318 RepID=A0A319EEQ8_ASPSB|nr:hypothetical protein BO78DRAFT_440283 [Aspergillus sclerotiicarbonarius CBS 121057]
MAPRADYQTLRVPFLPPDIDKVAFGRLLTFLPMRMCNGQWDHTANILRWSLAPAASETSHCRIATITFLASPDLTDFEDFLRGQIRKLCGDDTHLTVDVGFFGPTPLADPGNHAEIDIVAIHGLDGHAFNSWQAEKSPVMWLRDLLPEAIPKARIITYGYPAKLLKG